MKALAKLLFVIALATIFAHAQIQPGAFKHIVIVVQENRTTDNLFGAAAPITARCGQENNPTITGADIDNGAPTIGPARPTRPATCP
jgi:phospholipase C